MHKFVPHDAGRSRALRAAMLLLSLLVTAVAMVSCGGDSKSTPNNNPLNVAKVNVNPTSVNVPVNGTQNFFATAVDSSNNTVNAGSFTWTSSSPGVAIIAQDGTATAVSTGTTQITATVATITSSPSTLTVVAPLASVGIAPVTSTVKVGATQQFTATPKDAAGNTVSGVAVTWRVSFAGVATISTSGLLTGVAPGVVTVVAQAGNVQSAPATVTVTQ